MRLDLDQGLLPRWWEANKREVLAGVRFGSEEERQIVESRPPDRVRDDELAQPSGKPWREQRTFYTLFTAHTEWWTVQPMNHRRYFIWEGDPMVALPVVVQDRPGEEPTKLSVD